MSADPNQGGRGNDAKGFELPSRLTRKQQSAKSAAYTQQFDAIQVDPAQGFKPDVGVQDAQRNQQLQDNRRIDPRVGSPSQDATGRPQRAQQQGRRQILDSVNLASEQTQQHQVTNGGGQQAPVQAIPNNEVNYQQNNASATSRPIQNGYQQQNNGKDLAQGFQRNVAGPASNQGYANSPEQDRNRTPVQNPQSTRATLDRVPDSTGALGTTQANLSGGFLISSNGLQKVDIGEVHQERVVNSPKQMNGGYQNGQVVNRAQEPQEGWFTRTIDMPTVQPPQGRAPGSDAPTYNGGSEDPGSSWSWANEETVMPDQARNQPVQTSINNPQFLGDSTTQLSRDDFYNSNHTQMLNRSLLTETGPGVHPGATQPQSAQLAALTGRTPAQKPKELPLPVLLSALALILILGVLAAWYFLADKNDDPAVVTPGESSVTTVVDDPAVVPDQTASTAAVEVDLPTAKLVLDSNGQDVSGLAQATGNDAYKIVVENSEPGSLYELKINGESQGEAASGLAPFGFDASGRYTLEVLVTGAGESQTITVNQYVFETLNAIEYGAVLARSPHNNTGLNAAIASFDSLTASHENLAILESDLYENLGSGEYAVYASGFATLADATAYCQSKGLDASKCVGSEIKPNGFVPAPVTEAPVTTQAIP